MAFVSHHDFDVIMPDWKRPLERVRSIDRKGEADSSQAVVLASPEGVGRIQGALVGTFGRVSKDDHVDVGRRLAAALVGVMALVAGMVGGAAPARAATTTVTTFDQLKQALASAQDGDTVVVAADIWVVEELKITPGVTLTLTSDTGAHTLLRGPLFTGNMLNHGAFLQYCGGTLTITNLVLDGGSKVFDFNTPASSLIYSAGCSNLALGPGARLQNNLTNGPTVSLGNGAFTMTGDAAVTDNGSYGGSPAIRQSKGDVLITDQAVIADNLGGGISTYGSTMIVSGQARITGNSASSGGGIWADLVKLTITDDAVVSGNTASQGGGIWLHGYVDFEGYPFREHPSVLLVDGNARIEGNKTWGMGQSWYDPLGSGGGMLLSAYVQATITGNARVQDNYAADAGGGIALVAYPGGQNNGTLVVAGSARIDDNAALRGGGIYSSFLGSVTIKDGATVSGNSAAAVAGGIGFGQGGILRVGDDAKVTGNSTLGGYFNLYGDWQPYDMNDPFTGKPLPAAGGIYMGPVVDPVDVSPQIEDAQVGLPRSYTVLIDGNAVVSGNTAYMDGGGLGLAYGLTSPVLLQGNATVSDNSAPDGDGGGVHVATRPDDDPEAAPDMSQYDVLKVSQGVTFSGNGASSAHMLARADWARYEGNVQAASFTTPFTFGYNNLDIGYTNGVRARIVSYDAGGVSGDMPASVPWGVGETIEVVYEPVPSVDGRVFAGWGTEAGATTPTYTPDGTTSFVMPDADVTLYAVWRDVPVAPSNEPSVTPPPPPVVNPPAPPVVQQVQPAQPPTVIWQAGGSLAPSPLPGLLAVVIGLLAAAGVAAYILRYRAIAAL